MTAEAPVPGLPDGSGTLVGDAGTGVAPGGPSAVLRGVWHDRNGRIGLVVTGVLVLLAAVAVLGLTPHDPLDQHPADQLQGPSASYWFGTDQFGRDVAARTFAGIAASLRVALLSVAIAAVVGSIAGVASGYLGGAWDQLVGRLTDVLFAFPAILLALAVIAALGRGWFNTAIAIAIVYIPIFVRVARGPTLAVRELEYVAACRTLGFSGPRILFRHVLPNVSAPIVVQVALALSWAILTEAGLSFLGLGTQPPDPSLGLMVSEARNLVSTAWWTMAFPALAIVVAVIGLNLLGDGLRTALDPKEARP
jgi:peptide/nickel transport system permease protein